MTDQQIHDEVMTLLVSGFETTATALAWASHLVAAHPEVQDRLHAEADRVLGGRRPAYDDLAGLEYTRRVMAETSRLYPCIPMLTRRPTVDVEFGGRRVPAGSMILIPTHPLHHDAALYPEPERFDPDRWSPERSSGRERAAYIPFSLGIRGCIGEQFAKAEMAVVLSLLMSHWTLRPSASGRPVQPLVKATIVPSPVHVTITARTPAGMRAHI
jgi:pentalenene oxygenase